MKEMASKEAEAVSTEIQAKVHQIIRDVKAAYIDLSPCLPNNGSGEKK